MEFLFSFLGALFENIIESRKVRLWIKLLLLFLLLSLLLFILGQAIFWNITAGGTALSIIILSLFAVGISGLFVAVAIKLVHRKH